MSLHVAPHAAAPHAAAYLQTHDDTSLASMRQFGSVVRFAKNETIFSRGDDARYVYKILSGAVRLTRITVEGRRWIADFALSGDVFGFDVSTSYAMTAEAIGEVTAVRYLKSQIERAGDEESALRRELLTVLRQSLSDAQNHMMILTRQAATERVASFFHRLADRAGAEDGDAVEVPMRRQDIADYLGLTTETVCRAISEFTRLRIISVPNRRQIVVHDLEALADLTGGED